MRRFSTTLAASAAVALLALSAGPASGAETSSYRSYSGSQYVDGCRVTSTINSGVSAQSNDNGCAGSVGQRIWYIDEGSHRYTPTVWHKHQVTHFVLGAWAYRVSH